MLLKFKVLMNHLWNLLKKKKSRLEFKRLDGPDTMYFSQSIRDAEVAGGKHLTVSGKKQVITKKLVF